MIVDWCIVGFPKSSPVANRLDGLSNGEIRKNRGTKRQTGFCLEDACTFADLWGIEPFAGRVEQWFCGPKHFFEQSDECNIYCVAHVHICALAHWAPEHSSETPLSTANP